MTSVLEISIIIFLIFIQSIFGVGLLIFGTPSFLILGYDFANTINILMPISITISILQFLKSKVKDPKFVKEYNLFCLPFLVFFLIVALKFKNILDIKFLVALLLVFSSTIILNKKRFSTFKNTFFKLKKLILIIIGSVHGLSNMGGSFLAIYSALLSQNKKEIARYYICYGYLIMGILQYLTVLVLSYKYLEFTKLFYVLFVFIIYFPVQKLFKVIDDKKFSKYVNIIALIYGVIILFTYY